MNHDQKWATHRMLYCSNGAFGICEAIKLKIHALIQDKQSNMYTAHNIFMNAFRSFKMFQAPVRVSMFGWQCMLHVHVHCVYECV